MNISGNTAYNRDTDGNLIEEPYTPEEGCVWKLKRMCRGCPECAYEWYYKYHDEYGNPFDKSDSEEETIQSYLAEDYFWFCDSIGFQELPEFLEPAEEKKYFSVSFQWNETNADGFPVFCTNIAHARDQKAVEEHYRKYPWVRVREAGMAELHTARKRGMPIVEI